MTASNLKNNLKQKSMEVLLDFEFEKGLFFISIKNYSDAPVFDVKVSFKPGFTGHGGSSKIHALSLFKGISFMPPGKEIRIFMDSSHAYFKRKDPDIIKSNIAFNNLGGEKRSYTLTHNLAIYKDLVYLTRQPPGAI